MNVSKNITNFKKALCALTVLVFSVIGFQGCLAPPITLPFPVPVTGKVSLAFNNFLHNWGSPGALAKIGKGHVVQYVTGHQWAYEYFVYYTPVNLNWSAASVPYYPGNSSTQIITIGMAPGDINNQTDDVVTLSVPAWYDYDINYGYIEWGSTAPAPLSMYGNTATNPNVPGQNSRCNRYGKMLSFPGGTIPTSSFIFQMNTYTDPNNTFTCDCLEALAPPAGYGQ